MHFWKEITASFSLENFHWSEHKRIFGKHVCVYTWKVNAVEVFPNA